MEKNRRGKVLLDNLGHYYVPPNVMQGLLQISLKYTGKDLTQQHQYNQQLSLNFEENMYTKYSKIKEQSEMPLNWNSFPRNHGSSDDSRMQNCVFNFRQTLC